MLNDTQCASAISEAETARSVEIYCENLLEGVRDNYPLPEMLVKTACSPCGKYLLVGLFRPGLEPAEGADIWQSKPKSCTADYMEIVGGSDIFIQKRNLKGVWGKFAGRKDAKELSAMLVGL